MKWFRDTGDLGVSNQPRVLGSKGGGEVKREKERKREIEWNDDMGIGGVRARLLGDRL